MVSKIFYNGIYDGIYDGIYNGCIMVSVMVSVMVSMMVPSTSYHGNVSPTRMDYNGVQIPTTMVMY